MYRWKQYDVGRAQYGQANRLSVVSNGGSREELIVSGCASARIVFLSIRGSMLYEASFSVADRIHSQMRNQPDQTFCR